MSRRAGEKRKRKPHLIIRYKRLEKYLEANPGARTSDIASHFHIGRGEARELINGASLYPKARIYEEYSSNQTRNPKFYVLA